MRQPSTRRSCARARSRITRTAAPAGLPGRAGQAIASPCPARPPERNPKPRKGRSANTHRCDRVQLRGRVLLPGGRYDFAPGVQAIAADPVYTDIVVLLKANQYGRDGESVSGMQLLDWWNRQPATQLASAPTGKHNGGAADKVAEVVTRGPLA